MSEETKKEASLMLDYVRARWGDEPDVNAATRLETLIDPKLKERIDTLGFDAENLLYIESGDVFAELQKLEEKLMSEDARIESRAAKKKDLKNTKNNHTNSLQSDIKQFEQRQRLSSAAEKRQRGKRDKRSHQKNKR